MQGLWSGIQSLAGWIWDKVSGWISGIWDGICSFFGINSPSKEMAWVNEAANAGIVDGYPDGTFQPQQLITPGRGYDHGQPHHRPAPLTPITCWRI